MFIFYTGSSPTESQALRIGDPEIADWIPVFTGMTHSLSSPAWLGIHSDWIPVFTGMTHPLSSSTESQTLRIGDLEIADWIPVFTGMTEGVREWHILCHPQLDWGSTFLFVIPHLMRDPENKTTGFPFSREWRKGCGNDRGEVLRELWN